jgi:SpoVK/Ycf46/Vps4 family AAA+-type ATPase
MATEDKLKEGSVKLRVVEALQDDAYKGIARVDTEIMRNLGIKRGDIILIKGGKETVAIADRAYPADVGEGTVRIDGILRRNAKTGVGESVVVKKADVKEAKKILIAPIQKGIMVQADPETLRNGLLGRAVVKGDILVLGGVNRRRDIMSEDFDMDDIFGDLNKMFGGAFGNFGGFGGIQQIKFVVANTNPNQPVIITENTEVQLSQKAVEISDETGKALEVTYEDIGGLSEEVKKIREMVELPLKHPEIFERLGIEPPKGVLLHGPPGTGKTLLAKAVANETEANFILLNGPEIMDKWYGGSEKKVREVFEEAEKNAPSIIFIDEIDSIAPKREEVMGEVERRVVSQLLCLHPETPVYLKDEEKTIKELFESEKGGFVDEYGVENKIPKKEIYVKALSSEGKLSNARVIALTKTNVPEGFKIKLENGAEITSSAITKFLTINNEGVSWKNANEVLTNDFIFVPRKLNFNEKIQKINLYDLKEKKKWILKLNEKALLLKLFRKRYISLKELYDLDKNKIMPTSDLRNKILNLLIKYKNLKKEQIEQDLVLSRASLNNFLRNLVNDDLIKVKGQDVKINFSLDKIHKEINGLARKENEKIYPIKENYFITFPNIIDENLAKLLGIIISDGNLENYRANIFGETADTALKLSNELFLLNNKTFIEQGNKRLDIHSRAIVKFLNEYFGIPVGKKSYIVKIPEQIFNSPNSVKAAFLAGLFEGDGSVGNDIRFNSKSKELSYGISRLLLSLGIFSRMKEYEVYSIKIGGGYESFEKFKETILPYITLERKKTSLQKLIEKAKKISTIIYPIKNKLKEIRDNFEIRIDDNKYRYLSPKLSYNINSNILGYFIKKLGSIENKFVQEIRQIYNSDVIPCRVVDVEKVDGGCMYDLTTEFSNFLAGKIPVIVHNTMMDGLKSRGKVVVIGATNRPNSLDPALRRPGRFDREIEISVPDKAGRLSILKIHTRTMPLTKDVDLGKLAEITHGFVGADLAALAKEAAMAVLRKIIPKIQTKEGEEHIPEEILKELKISSKDFEEALKIVRPSAMREVLVETPNIKWDDVGGLDKVKQELKEAIEWPLKFPDSFKRMGIKPPRGLLLYGPPGTGKTLLAKAVAKESEANFIQVKGPSLLSMFVGESEKGIRKIFERARQVAPCIVFFDELDSLAGRRGLEVGSRVTEHVLNQLLAEMDGIEENFNVVIIGATNRPDILDPAILRPGRFDRILLVGPSEKKGRLEIFKIHTRNMPLAKDVSIDELAEKTEGYVGSYIEGVCREAAMLALRKDIKSDKVKKEHFEDAMAKIKPSVTKGDLEKYKKIEENYLKSAKAALEAGYLG